MDVKSERGTARRGGHGALFYDVSARVETFYYKSSVTRAQRWRRSKIIFSIRGPIVQQIGNSNTASRFNVCFNFPPGRFFFPLFPSLLCFRSIDVNRTSNTFDFAMLLPSILENISVQITTKILMERFAPVLFLGYVMEL